MTSSDQYRCQRWRLIGLRTASIALRGSLKSWGMLGFAPDKRRLRPDLELKRADCEALRRRANVPSGKLLSELLPDALLFGVALNVDGSVGGSRFTAEYAHTACVRRHVYHRDRDRNLADGLSSARPLPAQPRSCLSARSMSF